MKQARTNSRTLTQAAQQEIREAILSGTYSPGSQLPTEAELGGILGVSRTVVREALRTLEADGLIDRRHGVGTFVREQPILKNLNINFGITEMITAAGMVPGTTHLTIRRDIAGEEVASQLQLPDDAPIIVVERVRSADGRPVVYSVDMFATALIGLDDNELEHLHQESLYRILQRRLGYGIDYGIALVRPALATPLIAALLELPDDALLLCLIQTDFAATNQPLIYSCEYHLPDAFDFLVWRKGPSHLRG